MSLMINHIEEILEMVSLGQVYFSYCYYMSSIE